MDGHPVSTEYQRMSNTVSLLEWRCMHWHFRQLYLPVSTTMDWKWLQCPNITMCEQPVLEWNSVCWQHEWVFFVPVYARLDNWTIEFISNFVAIFWMKLYVSEGVAMENLKVQTRSQFKPSCPGQQRMSLKSLRMSLYPWHKSYPGFVWWFEWFVC